MALTIGRLLDRLDPRPDRTHLWSTSRVDGRFNDRAEKVLWSDANVGRLAERGSWTGRLEYIAHVMASWPESNRLYAHPFEWTWTNHKMRRWFATHAAELLALLMSGDAAASAAPGRSARLPRTDAP